MKRIVSLLVALPLLAACGLLSNPGPSLDGTEWLSIRVTDGGQDRPLVEGTQVRLSFDDDGVTASAGCNTIGGTYRIDGGRLTFEGGGMTEMGCDEPRHAQDAWLVEFLASQPMIALVGSELTLTAGDEVLVLQDREVADPDLPLIGTTWTVESLIAGDAVSSVPGDRDATLAFADDGSVDIDTGCNIASGRYKLDGGTMLFSDQQTTLTRCLGPGAELEAAIWSVLMGPGPIQWRIEAGTLTLMAGDQGLSPSQT